MAKTGFYIIILSLVVPSALFAQEPSAPFSASSNLSSQIDFKFMYYHDILENAPHSPKRSLALFANAEYYFLNHDYIHAEEYFKKYLTEAKNSNGHLFAYFYLWQIAKSNHDQKGISYWSEKIITFQQQVFIFRDKREITFHSPLNRAHRAVCRVDRIEFNIAGKVADEIIY